MANVAEEADSHELSSTGVRYLSGWTDEELTTIKFDSATHAGVALITLSRPKARNAWNEFMRNEIARSIDRASRMPTIRVIILTGDPAGRAFCAGADLAPAGRSNPSSM